MLIHLQAFAALPQNVTSNNTLVAETLLYHIYAGTYQLSANHTIARSALNTSDLVNLPGGQGQVNVLTGNGSSATSVLPSGNITSTAQTTYQNLNIYVIDQVLSVPTTVVATAQAAGLTGIVNALTQDAPALVTPLNTDKGVTIFVPSNEAFSAIASTIQTLNMSTISAILANHVIK